MEATSGCDKVSHVFYRADPHLCLCNFANSSWVEADLQKRHIIVRSLKKMYVHSRLRFYIYFSQKPDYGELWPKYVA